MTIETVLSKSDRDNLWGCIRPGKIGEWNLFGSKTHFRDITYFSGNTVLVSPVAGTSLASVRDEVKIVVKDYREELWGRPADEYFVTLSGYEYVPL